MNDMEKLTKELKDLSATFKSIGRDISAIQKDLDRLTLSHTLKSIEEYGFRIPYRRSEDSE